MRDHPPGSRERPVRPRLRVGPTSEFWRYLWFPAVFSVGALLLRQDLVFLLGALVVGCGLAAFPLARANLAHVRVSRGAPARASVGGLVAATVRVENLGRRAAVGLELEDRPGRNVRALTPRLELASLEAGERITVRTRLRFQRRGWTAVSPPQTASRFPLGVFRAVLPPGPGAEVLVRPREGRPTRRLLERLSGRSLTDARRSSAQPGLDDLAGVREWREGDDPRRVHPRVSARRGQAVVTRWQAEQGREVLLVLGPLEGGSAATFERAVAVMATLWRALRRLRRPARLMLGTQVLGSPRGLADLGTGLDRLAEAVPPDPQAVGRALERLTRRAGARSVLVVACGGVRGWVQRAERAAGSGGEGWVLDVRDPGLARLIRGLA